MPVDADVVRLLGALRHQIIDAEPVARLGEVGVVVGGQHGHGQQVQARTRLRLDRRPHGLRIGMHGEERRAELRDTFDPARNRVGDVVQFQVEEHALAGAGQPFSQRQAARVAELIADLVERHRLAQPFDHGFGRRNGGQVERHDQAVARNHRHGFPLS